MTDLAARPQSKRCVLLVVDALSIEVLRRHIGDGRLPNLTRFVEEHGQMHPCFSIFPSITPAATCSIATGHYPARHGIEGACWFDRETSEVAYFGDDYQLLGEKGFHDYLVDFGVRLNGERLHAPTIYQLAEEQHFESACINFMWFAGSHEHSRKTPWLLRLIGGKLPESVQGPKYLKLGDFAEALPDGVPSHSGRGLTGRYGFSDELTANCLLRMSQAGQIPPLTVGYFPENDDASHHVGPEQAAKSVLVRFDVFLGEFIEASGGWSQLGREFEILIVGDHGQTEYPEAGPKRVDVDQVLEPFQVADVGKGWCEGDQLFICPNMRAAAIYLCDPDDVSLHTRVVDQLLREAGIDQVIYEADDGTRCVSTRHRGHVRFRRAAKDEAFDGEDTYGNYWKIEGNLECLDCRLEHQRIIEGGNYPNPLERIDGSFVSGSRPIWATAVDGVEFGVQETRHHLGGSHASLNYSDSASALLTSSGVDLSILDNPQQPRIIDVTPLCLSVLGSAVATPERLGASGS